MKDPICDKKTSLELFNKFNSQFIGCLISHKSANLEYNYPASKLWNDNLLNQTDDKTLLNIISDIPFFGYKDSIHFVAQCQEGLVYHVFIGNYSNLFKPDNCLMGTQIICPKRISVSPSNILSIYALGYEVEIYSMSNFDKSSVSGNNFYNLTADDYKLKGNKEFCKGNYNNAILYFSKAIEFDSSNEIIYSNRANAYLKQKIMLNLI